MRRHSLYLVALFVILMSVCYTCRNRIFKTQSNAGMPKVALEQPPYPLGISALLDAYPNQILSYDGIWIHMSNGDSIVFSLNKELSHDELLDSPDLEGMFHDIYPLGPIDIPEFQSDPGRYRNDSFFKAIYGSSEDLVRDNLEPVDCFGVSVPFTRVNGAADSLRAVIHDLAVSFPHLRKYFCEPSSFYWRTVRGAERLSAHSFGIAIDIGVRFSNYWRWSNPGKDENDVIRYENHIPGELIQLFERHGFISGARWYHYDTMHFEFRPEIILYSQYKDKR